MQIKTITTLDISPENVGLIPVVADSLNYKGWKQDIINNALMELRKDNPEATEEDVTDDYSVNTFIKEFLSKDYTLRIVNLVSPVINRYFGLNEVEQAQALKDELANGAVVTEVTITE